MRFRSKLTRPPGPGTWTFAAIPATAIRAGGLRPRLRVVGTIDGAPIRSSLMPRGGGSLFVVVPRPVRARIGKHAGDAVELAIEVDRRPVILKVPPDLNRALGGLRSGFDAVAPSQRRIYLRSVADAKHEETRRRRIAAVVQAVRGRAA